ncbi:MAG: anti-sigma factor family protein [Armatimonadota bacterium]
MAKTDPCPISPETLSALADGEESGDEALRAHVAACPMCRAEMDGVIAIRRLLRRSSLRVPTPEGFWPAVQSRLDARDRASRSVVRRLLAAVAAALGTRWGLRLARDAVIAGAAIAALLALLWFAPPREPAQSPAPTVLQAIALDFQENTMSVGGRRLPYTSPAEAHSAFVAAVGYPMRVVTAPTQRVSFIGGRVVSGAGVNGIELAYTLGPHRISLYQVPDAGQTRPSVPSDAGAPRRYQFDAVCGCNIVAWREDGVLYALVSDLAHPTLLQIANHVKQAPLVGA